MYNFFKIILAVEFFRKIASFKLNLIIIGVSIIFMYIIGYIVEDLLKIIQIENRLFLYLGKWTVLIIFIFIIIFNIYLMFKRKPKPLKNLKNYKIAINKKEEPFKIDHLETKGEAIIKKYKNI